MMPSSIINLRLEHRASFSTLFKVNHPYPATSLPRLALEARIGYNDVYTHARYYDLGTCSDICPPTFLLGCTQSAEGPRALATVDQVVH